MPNPKAKFNRDGTRCSKNEKQLRRLPECGIFFIDEKPFIPDNPDPFDIDTTYLRIDKLKNTLTKPVFPNPLFPNSKNINYDKAPVNFGDVWLPEQLPQDDNNINHLNRRYLGQGQPDGYEPLKTNINPNMPRGLQEYEPILQRNNTITSSSIQSEIDIELANVLRETDIPIDTGEGVGFGLRRRNVIPLGEQEMLDFGSLDREFNDPKPMSNDRAKAIGKKVKQELKITDTIKQEEKVLAEVKKTLKKGNKMLSEKEVTGIVKRMSAYSIDKSTVKTILNDNNLFNEDIELMPIEERSLARQLAGNREEIVDSNFKPKTQKVTPFDIENIRSDTPLADRVGIRDGRPSFKKGIDKRAGRLPEELRSIYSKGSKATTDVLANLNERSSDLVKDINATKTRILGQKYNKITPVDIEMGLPANTTSLSNITTDADGYIDILTPQRQFPQDNEFAALSQEYSEGFSTKPLPKLRTTRFVSDAGIGVAGAAGGMLAGIGMSKFLSEQGVDGYGNAAISGTFGGSVGVTTAKVTEDVLIKTGIRTGARLTGQSLLKSALKGGGIGAVFSVGLMPVDMALNGAFLNSGMSHAEANVASGGIVGGVGFAGTVAATALLFGAETLGLSVVIGAVALLASELFAWWNGAQLDREEKERKQKQLEVKQEKHDVTLNRTDLIGNYLSESDMDFDKALNMYKNLNPDKDIGENDAGWETFRTQMSNMFRKNPINDTDSRTADEILNDETEKLIRPMITELQEKYKNKSDKSNYINQLKEIYEIRDKHIAEYNHNKTYGGYANDLVNKYIAHSLSNDADFCADGDCPAIKQNDKGELTPSEIDWLNKYSNGTWLDGANLQLQINKSGITSTRARVAEAQTYLLEQWNTNKLAPEDLDPKYLKEASIDPTFKDRFYEAITTDAQQTIIRDYYNNQTKIGQLPDNLTKIANLDTDFDEMIHHLYSDTENLSSQLKITIPQLIQIQRTDETQQSKAFEIITFDNSKQDPDYVEKALKIYHANTLIKSKGFYDVDEARMDLDPTSIKSWKPTDSQILQAHQSGMTLIDYQNYMIELSKGEKGNFDDIPVYDKDVIRATGIADFSHFQEELNVAGYDSSLYMYNKDSLEIYRIKDWIDNPQILEKNTHIDKYLPENVANHQEDYAKYITGINMENNSRVNEYNNQLFKSLKTKYGGNTTELQTEYNSKRINYEYISTVQPVQTEEVQDDNTVETTSTQPVSVADAV